MTGRDATRFAEPKRTIFEGTDIDPIMSVVSKDQ